MKIGYVVEGINDYLFLTGLRDRWCEHATLESLNYRGSLHPRKYPNVCKEGRFKGCDVVVILTDSDNSDWNTAYKNQKAHLDADIEYVVLGVAVRNIECWICADPDYIAKHYPCDPKSLRVSDPKSAFHTALSISKYDKKEEDIVLLVSNYPSLKPMLELQSFRRFYKEARDYAQRNGCAIPNELES